MSLFKRYRSRFFTPWLLVTLISLSSSALPAQRVLFGHLESYLTDYVEALPGAGSNVYRDPEQDDLLRLGEAVKMLLKGDLTGAQSQAELSGYEVIRYVDNAGTNNREFWGLQPQPGSDLHWGILMINPTACRNVILQCPHPRFDSNTGKQGAYLLLHMDVKGLMISGTHRCNSIAVTSCSGTTTACGSNAPYRLSDIAHNDESLFQTITRILAESGLDYFIQLHGFAKSAGDPNLIISNGTRLTPEDDPIARLRDGLYAIDPALSFKIVHIHQEWTKLTAFTNTQGRYLNDSPDPCLQNASKVSGRFIHIEQEFERFRKDESGWELMRQGLVAAFACEVVAIDPRLSEPTPLVVNVVNGYIRIENPTDDRPLQMTVVSVDGKTWYTGRYREDQVYPLPAGVLYFLVIRDWNKGTLLASKKIFLNGF